MGLEEETWDKRSEKRRQRRDCRIETGYKSETSLTLRRRYMPMALKGHTSKGKREVACALRTALHGTSSPKPPDALPNPSARQSAPISHANASEYSEGVSRIVLGSR